RLSELGDRAFFRVAYDHGVYVAAHDPARIVNRLPLGHGREGKAGGVAYGASKTAKRRTKAHAGTGARLEKQVPKHRTLQDPRHLLAPGDGLHLVRNPEEFLDRLARKLIHGKQLVLAISGDSLTQWPGLCALRIFLQQGLVFGDLSDEAANDLGHRSKFL